MRDKFFCDAHLSRCFSSGTNQSLRIVMQDFDCDVFTHAKTLQTGEWLFSQKILTTNRNERPRITNHFFKNMHSIIQNCVECWNWTLKGAAMQRKIWAGRGAIETNAASSSRSCVCLNYKSHWRRRVETKAHSKRRAPVIALQKRGREKHLQQLDEARLRADLQEAQAVIDAENSIK